MEGTRIVYGKLRELKRIKLIGEDPPEYFDQISDCHFLEEGLVPWS
jgi:hypothetical protein